MKKLVLILVAVSLSLACMAKTSDKKTKEWLYDIECAGVGAQGTYLVKVYSYSNVQSKAQKQAVKNAVHGVIFKGVMGKGRECNSQRPLVKSDVASQHEDFFKNFFAEGGEYAKYASATGAPETSKVGSQYKVGVVVSVQKDQLRRDLEEAGIIKGLSSGF
ncbi:MAG: hypothetical protein MJ007_07665 [Paludibacteraceae bacterium]|nr:hypothetical protein [Paludibacteraceae bacterium]